MYKVILSQLLCVDTKLKMSQKLWREYCEKFFCENPDPKSRRIMDCYMIMLQTGRCDVKEDERVVAMFAAMSKSISEFERIKNEVRHRYHQNASKKREHTLKETIRSFVKASEDEDFELPNLQDVKTFSSNYGQARGCQPFVYGLCEFLRMQIGKSQVYYWDCNDVALTDTGVDNFASDAARLMCANLQTKPQDASKDGTRRWHMNRNLKDSTIQKILSIFPSLRELKRSSVRPTGRRGETAFDRSKDALDSHYSNCCCAVS